MKLAKLSLAAIMTVGAISAANATSLEEAIKGVDVSGYAHYRLQDDSLSEGKSEIELRATITTPVQEDAQLVTRFTADYATSFNDATGNSNLSTGDKTDDNEQITLDRVFINYTGINMTTVSLGRMDVSIPFFDTYGEGAMVKVAPVTGLTLTAAYFSDTKAISNAIAAAGVAYSNEMFNAKLWYVDVAEEDTVKGSDSLFVEAGVNVGPVSVKGQYAQKDPDAAGALTQKTYRFQVDGQAGPVALKAGYIGNDDNGGDVMLDGNWDADGELIYAGLYGVITNDNTADDDIFFLEANAPVGPVSLKLGYVDYDTAAYKNEIYGQVSYNVTKKFNTMFRYSTADSSVAGAEDLDYARFQATYSF